MEFDTKQVTEPSINGQTTDLASALREAAKILALAKRPLFGGLGTDVAGARALYELAARSGAALDHLYGDALAASTTALQDRGALFTTLSEIRARADLVIVFACEPSRRYPRFYERISNGERDMRYVFVGCGMDPVVQSKGESVLQNADPFDLLAQWSALVEGGRMIGTPSDAAALAALTERIRAARYTAFVYAPAELPAPHAALAIEALHRIIKALNRDVRAGALALGGDDGALTVNQTITWLSGFPLRTRVAYGLPLDHDPYRYRAESLTRNDEIDALLWVSSFSPQPLPDSLADDVPAIVLSHPATTHASRKGPTVVIPVATPGVDSDAHLFRVDTSVALSLHAAVEPRLPSVATIAHELVRAWRSA